MSYRILALTLLALAASAPAAAQISTDRPGLGFNASVVDRGTFQVEAGLPQATRVDASVGGADASITTFSFPVQLRYGLTDAVELRLGSSLYDVTRLSVDTPVGGGDDSDGDAGLDVVELGAKVQLATNGPTVALIPSVLVPTTEAADLAVAARAVAGWALTDRVGLTTVLGAVVSDADPDASVTGEAVAVVGTSFTDALSGYAEVGAYPGDDATPVYAGGGLAFLVTPDLQLDASFDLGLTDEAADLLFGAGASIRF